MDKIRVALSWLKKHHFWVLTAIVVLVSLFCWYSAATDLSEQYETAKSAILSEFSNQNQLTNSSFHANEQVNEEQIEQNTEQAREVAALWQELYEAQQEAVLTWPDALPGRFHREIVKLKFGDDIHENLRDTYLNYAKRHFPNLPKIVDAIELPEGSGGGSGGRGGRASSGPTFNMDRFEEMMASGRLPGFRSRNSDDEPPQMSDYTVYWQDQNKIRNQLNFSTRPSSLRVWVTQEDLWVYTTLLQIVASTNEVAGATRISNAAVPVIESLDVGQVAAQASRGKGRVIIREPSSGSGEMGERGTFGSDYGRGGMGGEYSGRSEYGGEGGEMGAYSEYGMEGRMGPGSEGGEDTSLVTQRYLDSEGEPVEVTGSVEPSQFGTEYKRLPVRLILHMDQRWLYQLISACANAPLQVEVQEVRINPLDGNQRGRNRRMYDLTSGRRNLGFGRNSGRSGNINVNIFDRRTHIVPVVIQGVIYIFNEPDLEALTIAEDSA